MRTPYSLDLRSRLQVWKGNASCLPCVVAVIVPAAFGVAAVVVVVIGCCTRCLLRFVKKEWRFSTAKTWGLEP